MNPILDAASITVRAGARTILDGVSLAVESGRTVALVGPNGAGKSTLLRVLSGELTPQSGRVRLLERELASYSPPLLALHRAVLSQHVHVAFPFTVAEIVRMGAGMSTGRRHDAEAEKLIESALDEVGLQGLADRDITTLSGGEQQRAHFARALVQLARGQEQGGAGILLLDEPAAGLDLRHQLAMIESIRRRARRGVLVVAVFHDLNLAAMCAERVIVLDQGRIDCDGCPGDALTSAMLERVFGVETTVTRETPSAVPIVLPRPTRRLP